MVAAKIISTTQYRTWRSETGQTQTYRTAVIQWPVAVTSIRQNYYRFYEDNDAITPTVAWDGLGENTSITAVNNPLAEGEVVRIRMTLKINNASVPASTEAFKLQFGRRDTTCSAISAWEDVGGTGSGSVWRGVNGTPVDGTTLPSTLISISDVAGTYEESNNTAVNPSLIDLGEDIEYDWVVQHNGAVQRSDYCFRMVKTDDSLLNSYDNYPTLRTTGYTPVSGDWRWFDDETSITPSSALAAENVAPANVENNNILKLRTVVEEIEGAAGGNVKFALQYSEDPTFSSNVVTLTSTSTCTATSTWCYAEGAGVDNALIDAKTLTNADSCSGGSGIGCGTHNEIASSSNTLTQPANSNMEFEFTLTHPAARVNTVYYFRLYDVANDTPLLASSTYPSLVTKGGELTFTVEGVGSGQSTEGVTTDVATTPVSIPFGSVPFDTDYTAAYRLTVDVNATEGYQMFMYANQDLLDSYGNRIEPITGTNASPLAWSSGCTGATPGCIGYHAGDDALSGGASSTRFFPDNTYAALSTTTPEEVMFSSQPTTNETSDLIFRIRVSEEQPAGLYESEVIFISVPLF